MVLLCLLQRHIFTTKWHQDKYMIFSTNTFDIPDSRILFCISALFRIFVNINSATKKVCYLVVTPSNPPCTNLKLIYKYTSTSNFLNQTIFPKPNLFIENRFLFFRVFGIILPLLDSQWYSRKCVFVFVCRVFL
jgi:hypothetical protein